MTGVATGGGAPAGMGAVKSSLSKLLNRPSSIDCSPATPKCPPPASSIAANHGSDRRFVGRPELGAALLASRVEEQWTPEWSAFAF